jgi:uncharacterized protein YciI
VSRPALALLARLAVLSVAALAGASCAGAAAASHEQAATHDATHDVTLVLIKTGPKSGQLPDDETKTLFAGHFANMNRMSQERQLLLAGPYTKQRHDLALRGIFVLDTGDLARASQIAGTDPPTQAGIFTLEFHALATDAPLRAFHERVLKLDAEADAKAKAEGRVRQPGEGARSYVLLTAEDGERSRRALEPLVRSGSVLLLARLDGTRTFAVLDAADPDAAQAALGGVAGELGDFVLDGWFASGELAQLPALHD